MTVTRGREPLHERADATGRWHEIDRSKLPEDGRVRSVTVDGRSLAVSRCTGRFGALENRCPHQGGPLGEGSVEQGWLRCPWHGYDYDPLTGNPPEGFADGVTAYDVEERDDHVHVSLPDRVPAARSVRMGLERRAATMGQPQRKGIIVDFVVVRRLLLETTFVPLFLGVLALASALENSGAGLWQDVLKYVGAFLIALTCSRHYSALELRERSTERPSRPS